MGTVYRAVQLGVGRPVAVKLMPIISGDDAAVARFEREAHTAGALDHPHCLPLYAAGESDGLLYLVMRLVNGPDLRGMIDQVGWLPPVRAATIIEQVSGAVQAAHDAGLVHRDLKPANILIEQRDERDHAYVSDFGLMRAVVDDREITLAGQRLGTPAYAAPEQMAGAPVGPAADIYALGAVLDQMLGPQRSQAAEAVIAKATAKAPADRYNSAREFGLAAQAALVGAPSSRSVLRLTPRPAFLMTGLVVGLLAVVVTAVLVLTQHSGGSGSNSTATVPPTVPGQLTTAAFTAVLPHGWHANVTEQQLPGYRRTIVQSPTASVIVNIDRTPDFRGSTRAKMQSVEAAVERQTPGYHRLSMGPVRFAGGTVLIWAFSQPGSERVDVFRRVGTDLFAVLGVSSSQRVSRDAATAIAYSLKLR